MITGSVVGPRRSSKALPKVKSLDCKEIQPVHSEGDQAWDFSGRNDAEAETPVLWPPHAKSWLIGKESDAGRDWGQEEKGTTEDEVAGWHHWLDGRWIWMNSGSWWWTGRPGGSGSQRVKHDWATELNWKKGHGHCLLVCCLSDPLVFWIPAKPLHLRSRLSKLMRYTENCNTCSWHWSAERAKFFSMTTPNHTSHEQGFKSWTNRATKFCLICHIHPASCQPTTTSSDTLTTSYKENASTTSRGQKMLSKNPSNPEAWIFVIQE